MKLQQIRAISELTNLLYDFLPGSRYSYADQSITFPGCAARVGVSQFWPGGSKKPAINKLLLGALELDKAKFCNLIREIVKTAIPYRIGKANPITRDEMEGINKKIHEIGFRIKDLVDEEFLKTLPRKESQSVPKEEKKVIDTAELVKDYMDLSSMDPQPRGYAFEKFLNKLFVKFQLSPRDAFRIKGEQIDGSFELDGQTYLLEAKWQAKKSAQDELLIFNGKVEGKSSWARGVFISYIGFSDDGLEAFSRGKRTSIIGMNGMDILFVLEGRVSLSDLIKRKARRAVETNEFFVSVHELV